MTVKRCLDNLVNTTQDATIDACIEVIDDYRISRYGGNGPREVLNEAIDLLRTMKTRLGEARAARGEAPHGGAGGGDDDTPQCEASYPGVRGTCIFTAANHPDHHQAPDGWRWRA